MWIYELRFPDRPSASNSRRAMARPGAPSGPNVSGLARFAYRRRHCATLLPFLRLREAPPSPRPSAWRGELAGGGARSCEEAVQVVGRCREGFLSRGQLREVPKILPFRALFLRGPSMLGLGRSLGPMNADFREGADFEAHPARQSHRPRNDRRQCDQFSSESERGAGGSCPEAGARVVRNLMGAQNSDPDDNWGHRRRTSRRRRLGTLNIGLSHDSASIGPLLVQIPEFIGRFRKRTRQRGGSNCPSLPHHGIPQSAFRQGETHI